MEKRGEKTREKESKREKWIRNGKKRYKCLKLEREKREINIK